MSRYFSTTTLGESGIYDSKEAPARLLGIEYIISNETYQALPAGEKKYWHPHAYEIISGQLIVPDLSDMGDKALEGFLTSWGKTFHTWPLLSITMEISEFFIWRGWKPQKMHWGLEGIDKGIMESPVPSGLNQLSDALKTFVRFLVPLEKYFYIHGKNIFYYVSNPTIGMALRRILTSYNFLNSSDSFGLGKVVM